MAGPVILQAAREVGYDEVLYKVYGESIRLLMLGPPKTTWITRRFSVNAPRARRKPRRSGG